MKLFAKNKRAFYDYEIQDVVEAGIILQGHEVKSVKTGHISLKGSYVSVNQDEAWLLNAHIPPYKHASDLDDYNPDRSRKLLLHRNEIKRFIGKKQERGISIVPIKVYGKRGLIKVQIGIGRGKRNIDKREKIKQRQDNRDARRMMRGKN